MTEAEIIELVGLHSTNAITSFTVFISFTFAFLAATHFTGSSLTAIQSVGATALYVAAATAAAISQALFHQIIFRTVDSAPSPIDDLLLMNEAAWVWGMLLLEAVTVIASIFFMWSVRHPNA